MKTSSVMAGHSPSKTGVNALMPSKTGVNALMPSKTGVNALMPAVRDLD